MKTKEGAAGTERLQTPLQSREKGMRRGLF